MNSSENSLRYPGWGVAAAGGVGVFVSFASVLVYTFGVFLKPLAESFHWSREAVSGAFAIAALTVAVCSPFIGILLDRFGPRRIILPSLTIFGLAFASLKWLTPNLWHLYITFFVLGVVGNGTAQMAYSRAISTWFERRRGMAFAMLMSGGAVGAMLLPGVAQNLIRTVGWRDAYFYFGVGVLLLGIPVVAVFVRERQTEQSETLVVTYGASVRSALTSRAFWLTVGTLFLASLGQNSAITHLPALLSDRGIPAASAALPLSILGAASLLGRLGTGWLLDRYFAPRVSFLLLLVAAAGLTTLAFAHSLALGCLGAALIGLGMGGEADVTPYLISRYFPLRSFAAVYGFTWTAYAIAGAAGPVWIGKQFDRTTQYEIPLLQLSSLTLLAAMLMLMMPAYQKFTQSRAKDVSVEPLKLEPAASAGPS